MIVLFTSNNCLYRYLILRKGNLLLRAQKPPSTMML